MSRAPLIFGAFVVVLVAVIVAPMVIDFTKTDTDEHGRIAVPGEQVLELPEGDLGVYYGERRRMRSRRRGNTNVPDPLPVPGLEVRAVSTDGGAEAQLRTAFVDGVQVGGVRRTTKQFGVLEVPADGDYRVSVRNRERIRYPDPVLSLGSDSTDQTEFAPSDWLLDNLQLVILIAVGVLIGAAIVPKFLPGRRGGPPPPPSSPPPAGGGGPIVRL